MDKKINVKHKRRFSSLLNLNNPTIGRSPLLGPAISRDYVINTIHDQICCSCKDGEEKELAAYMKEVMEKPFHFSDFVFTGSPSINRRWK